MAKKSVLSEAKAKKIAVGITVAGVLLIMFLLIVMIIQFVQMGVKSSQLSDLEATKQRYEEMNEEGRRDLEYYQTEEGLYYLSRKYGWR